MTTRTFEQKKSDASKALDVSSAPSLVVIIPVYKHSALLVEAVQSALTQQLSVDLKIIIVNDGCPFLETHLVGTTLQAAHNNVEYIYKKNGGPSSARNIAIEYIIDNYSEASCVFFLDADNRLSEYALETAYKLLSARPDIGWVYPHISAFEVNWNGDYSSPYSKLFHIAHNNVCDTGSLIKIELLKKIRFNENARSGFEDWDFWLAAIAAGYKGICCSEMGFEYRNRAESRFKEVSRDRGAVTGYLRERYKHIFTPRTLLRFEHEECPRFAYYDVDAMQFRLFSDPILEGQRLSVPRFCQEFWAAAAEPEMFNAPDYFLWGGSKVLNELTKAKLIHNLFWIIQRLLKNNHFVAVKLLPSADDVAIDVLQIRVDEPLSSSLSIIAGRSDIIRQSADDESDEWLKSIISLTPGPKIMQINVRGNLRSSHISHSSASLLSHVLLTRTALRDSVFRRSSTPKFGWRDKISPAINDGHKILEKYLGCDAIIPWASDAGRANIGFVVPFASFGGSEKVGYAVAQQLRKYGFKTHLFVVGGNQQRIISEFYDAFDTINFFGFEHPFLWGGSLYGRGTEFPNKSDNGLHHETLLGMTCAMDVVINCQSAPFNAIAGDLKGLGIRTLYYIHLFDRSSVGREVGHPFLGMLYEHAYDKFLLCSENLAHRLHGLGVPRAKLMTIQNAPSFTVDASQLDIALTRRSGYREGPLKILYIGRLDVQKGVERVIGLAEACAVTDIDVSFRLIGASLVDAHLSDKSIRELWRARISVEPPVFRSDQLHQVFLDADVLILPSRWEGAPLVILEAQQSGCVPIATDVGAVSELINSWQDGVLIPDEDDAEVVACFIEAITRLANDRDTLRKLSLTALDRVSSISWDKSASVLADYLCEVYPDKNKKMIEKK